MKIPAALRLALLAAFMALPAACPKPVPGQPGNPGIISCTVDAVRDNGPALIPKVNDCLTAPSSWEACLISLIKPVAGITEDVLACVVQAEGHQAAAAAGANARDGMSATRAERASAFIKSRGYVFAQ